MSLMELIIKVVKVKGRDLTIILVNSLVIIMFYYLFFENSEVVYPIVLSSFVTLIYFIIEVIKYKSFMEKLDDSKRSPSYSCSNVDSSEEYLLNVIGDIHNEYLNRIHGLSQQKGERDALFSQWIHNMKTSITVIDLACDKSDLKDENKKYIDDIREENNSLKKSLEECLNVLRLDDFSRDYIPSRCNLKKLITNVVNTKKRDFIYKGVFPKVNIDEKIEVFTDKKWCGYMVEQIISNAIKYSKDSDGKTVEIIGSKNYNIVELVIRDRGIGICDEDLSRVFDPFFTGNNGRTDRGATGVGLYMVKIISKKLGHEVEIKSEVSVGTEVKIIFKSENII